MSKRHNWLWNMKDQTQKQCQNCGLMLPIATHTKVPPCSEQEKVKKKAEFKTAYADELPHEPKLLSVNHETLKEQEKVEYICSGHDTHSWCKDCAHNHNHPLWIDGQGVGCNDPNCNIKSRGNKICEVVK